MDRSDMMGHLEEHGMVCFRILAELHGCTRGQYDACMEVLKASHKVQFIGHRTPSGEGFRIHFIRRPRQVEITAYKKMLDAELAVMQHPETSWMPDTARNWFAGKGASAV